MGIPAEQKNIMEWKARFVADWQTLWLKDLCAAPGSGPARTACTGTEWPEAWKAGFQAGWNEGLWKGRKSEAPHTARVLAARRMLAAGKYEELMISAATKLTCAEIRKLAAEEPGPDTALQTETAPLPRQETGAEDAHAAGYREGMEEGRREGVLESRQMAAKFIAMRMLDLGRFTKEEVAEATALPLKRVEALYVPSKVRKLPTRIVGN